MCNHKKDLTSVLNKSDPLKYRNDLKDVFSKHNKLLQVPLKKSLQFIYKVHFYADKF